MQADRYLRLARDAVEDDPPGPEVAVKMLVDAMAMANRLAAIVAVAVEEPPCEPPHEVSASGLQWP